MPPLFGVDVSSHKGTVDWAKVAAAGFTFAINRACLDTKPDATWAANHKAAKAHGLIPGAYHFLYPSVGASAARPAADQCDAFLEVIGDPAGMLIALDVESDGAGTYQPRFSDVLAWVSRFRHFWPKHPIIIYSGAWYWDSAAHPIHNADGSSIGPLWDSHYVQGAAAPAGTLYGRTAASWWGPRYGGWDHVSILQFSSSGLVPGVPGTCDVNAFRGTLAELRALASSTPEVEMPGIHIAPRGTEDTTPLDAFLTAKIKGAGHSIFRVFDGARVAVADGLNLGTVERARFVAPLPPWANGDPDCVVFNKGADGQHVAVIRDIAPGTLPATVVNCDAAVATATAPLNAEIASLKNDVSQIATLERNRIAEAEAARIKGL